RPTDHAMRKLMGAKFAEERKAIHRLIDSHIKRGPNSELRTVDVNAQDEEGNNNPTTVADMSRYLRSAHETVVSRIDPNGLPLTRRQRIKRRLLIAAGVVFVVAASGYAGWASHSEDPPAQATVAAPPNAPAATPVSPVHAALESAPEQPNE